VCDFPVGGEGVANVCGEDGAGFGVEEIGDFAEDGAVEVDGVGGRGRHSGRHCESSIVRSSGYSIGEAGV